MCLKGQGEQAGARSESLTPSAMEAMPGPSAGKAHALSCGFIVLLWLLCWVDAGSTQRAMSRVRTLQVSIIQFLVVAVTDTRSRPVWDMFWQWD